MGLPGIVPGLEQKYPYGEYGQGSNIGKLGGLTVSPKVGGIGGGNPYGLTAAATQAYAPVDGVSQGRQGVGLGMVLPDQGKYVDGSEYTKMFIA